MQLAVLLAILTSFLALQAAPETLSSPPAWLLLAACLLAAPLATFALSAWVVHGIDRDYPSHGRWIDRYQWLQRGAMALWLAAILVAFYAGHWPVIVRDSGAWSRWPLAADLATIAPVIAVQLALYVAQWHDHGRTRYGLRGGGRVTHSALHCRRSASMMRPSPPSFGRFLVFIASRIRCVMNHAVL